MQNENVNSPSNIRAVTFKLHSRSTPTALGKSSGLQVTPVTKPHRACGTAAALPPRRDFVSWRFSNAGGTRVEGLVIASVRKPAQKSTYALQQTTRSGCKRRRKGHNYLLAHWLVAASA
jgi:hypothetical protein